MKRSKRYKSEPDVFKYVYFKIYYPIFAIFKNRHFLMGSPHLTSTTLQIATIKGKQSPFTRHLAISAQMTD